jgi:hypothetical protein
VLVWKEEVWWLGAFWTGAGGGAFDVGAVVLGGPLSHLQGLSRSWNVRSSGCMVHAVNRVVCLWSGFV